ncbi:IS21 family transposase [Candidatus Bipolaricaulota bacterium]|nr:IS21 family transposase [Candidatus Bipolaricaulota bacterium]
MLHQVERSYIKLLGKNGVSQKEIARRTNHTRKTIRRVLKEPTDKEYRRKDMGSIVDKYVEDIKRWIKQDLTVKRMLEKAREDEDKPYQGGKTIFYDRVKKIREEMEAAEDAVVRFETLPGEQLQVDWGEATIDYDRGQTRKEYFFAARMSYSRYTYVELREDMKLETLINCLLHTFEDLGGVPLSVTFDNMKTVVTGRDEKGYPDWNDTFFKFATELDFHPTLCSPRQPNQKGSVENLVRYVKNNFLAGRCFQTRDDLKDRLAEWLTEVNEERTSRATEEIPVKLLEERELEKLQPLKATSDNYGLLRYLTVTREGTVHYQTNEYSVPVELIGKTVETRIHPDRVRIYHENDLVADHPRSSGRKERVREPDHYEHTFKKKPRAQVMLYREKLLSLNHGISDYVEKVVRKNVANQRPHVVGIYDLLEEHGKEKLAELCRKCADRNLYGIDYLKVYLEDGDKLEAERTDNQQEELTLTGLPDQGEVNRDMETYERLVQGGGS